MQIIKIFFRILIFIISISIIGLAFWPVAKWYYEANPLKGTDFYYTATLVNHLKNNPLLPSFKWLSIWFSGWSFLSNFPILQYYLILPLTYFINLISAVKIWMIVSSLLYFLGSYLVFKRISKNVALSVILTIGIIYSTGFYGALIWGGSLPSFATQSFLPWIIYSIIIYLDNGNKKFLAIACILSGLAVISHPQMVIAYIIPSSVILFIFSFSKLSFFTRFKSLIFYGLMIFLIGLPILYSSMGSALSSLVVKYNIVDSSIQSITSNNNPTDPESGLMDGKPDVNLVLIRTNPIFFVLLEFIGIIYFAHIILSKNKKIFIFNIIPYLLIVLFYIFYVILYSNGISIYHGGWYRLFWSMSFWSGLLIAVCWGEIQHIYKQQIQNSFIFNTGLIIVNILIAVSGFFMLMQIIPTFQKINQNLYSLNSSAFPDLLNKISSDNDVARFKQNLVPTWLNPDNKNYRLYIADQTINIWWNTYFSMPLARGYLDQPVSFVNRGYTFWMDAAFNYETKSRQNELTGLFNYPESISQNNAEFMLDWYSIKYFEAADSLVAIKEIYPYLKSSTFIKNDQEIFFDRTPEKPVGQRLHFYEIKDEFVSPILLGINSPTLGIVASDKGYETIIRSLADANLGLKKVIPLKLGSDLNKISNQDLQVFDALLIYDYQYKNKSQAFGILEKFVKSGKKIYIDSGIDNKEVVDQNLPAIFPITKFERAQLGRVWNLNFYNNDINKDVDINKFSPPLFGDDEWNFSYPQQNGDIRQNSQILIANFEKPILLSQNLGQGQVLWSGMNFPYHVTRFHNEEEIKLWRNILNILLPQNTNSISEFNANYITDEKRIIKLKNTSGVLFKEESYPGWSAKIENTNMKIYAAGPSYPGFMYVHIPDNYSTKESSVIFEYHGSPINHLLVSVALLIILLLLDIIIFSGALIINRIKNILNNLNKFAFSWWNKDDDKQ